MNKKRVFSGTRASGQLHLGNYLGAVKGYIELQNNPDYETIYMVMDLHAITTPYETEELEGKTKGVILDYLACGLDPSKSIITAQSLVPEHTYLANLFSSVVTIARMQHLPTYKEKVTQHPDANTAALLNYPILMAADILLYKAELVPVGIDQEPHLEVAREIARKMNDNYRCEFPEPKRFATKGEYIPSLSGEGKMSKSVEGSYINLTDTLDEIKAKLSKAPTDSGKGTINVFEKTKDQAAAQMFLSENGSEAKGVDALLKLVGLFEGSEKRDAYIKEYSSSGVRYGDLKTELAEAIYGELKPIQERRRELETKKGYIEEVIASGAERAGKIAKETISEVKEKMGLIRL